MEPNWWYPNFLELEPHPQMVYYHIQDIRCRDAVSVFYSPNWPRYSCSCLSIWFFFFLLFFWGVLVCCWFLFLSFFVLIAYQLSLVIQCQTQPFRRTVMILFNLLLQGSGVSCLSQKGCSTALRLLCHEVSFQILRVVLVFAFFMYPKW